jgi:hypothetical protein
VHDIFDGHAELRRHLLAEIDRHPGITSGLVPGGPERAAGRADRDRHPQLAGRRDFVLQGIGACGTSDHHRDPQNDAGDARQGLIEHRILPPNRLVMVELHRPLWSIAGSVETRIPGRNGKLLERPQAARTVSRNLPTSSLRRLLSPDND